MLKTKQTDTGLIIVFEGKLDSLNANEVFEETKNILRDNNSDLVLNI